MTSPTPSQLPPRSPNPQELQLVMGRTLDLPRDENERLLGIRKSDWNRIKKRVGKLKKPFPWLSTGYNILIGIAVTAGASIYPLWITPSISPWIIPLYACTTFFSIFVAVILFLLEKKMNISNTDEISEVLTEMDDIQPTSEQESDETQGNQPSESP